MILHYVDNEVPWGFGEPPAHYGEWTGRVQSSGSTIAQSAAASFPERGAVGLRAGVSGPGIAYVRKDFSGSPTVALGFWLRLPSGPVWSNGQVIEMAVGRNDAANKASFTCLLQNSGGQARLAVTVFAGNTPAQFSDTLALAIGRWHYVALVCAWGASSATADLYLDGVWRGRAAVAGDGCANIPDNLRLGCTWVSAGVSATLDYDEVKIADAYPQPHVPAPGDEHLAPVRAVVLYRGGSADSQAFADCCVSQLGIPRANLIRLDAVSGEECLADYAGFQCQVEAPIADYFALNPAVAANCMCFLIGHGVPGYFDHGGVRHSAVSRLMNYGTAFSPGAPNPLHLPGTASPTRLGKADLGGRYLACRIDADTLSGAEGMLARAAEISAHELLDADTLFTDDNDYRSSLSCRQLRILLAEAGNPIELRDDALVWANLDLPLFSVAAGSRAVFCDLAAGSADSLRTGAGAVRTALSSAGYAAGVGNSGPADTFNPRAFFEMLRIGGSFAEAVAVSVAHLDYTATAVGSPLMTVAFPRGGYNIYRGEGSVDDIDWTNPVACVGPARRTAEVTQALPPGRRHLFAARAVSRQGIEEGGARAVVYVEADENGRLLSALPPRPTDLAAEWLSPSQLLLSFSCCPPGRSCRRRVVPGVQRPRHGSTGPGQSCRRARRAGRRRDGFRAGVAGPANPGAAGRSRRVRGPGRPGQRGAGRAARVVPAARQVPVRIIMNGLMLHFGAPANPVIRPVPPGVYVDGRRRRDLHVTGWHVAAAPDFGKAAVELTPAGRCASARRIEHIRALPPVGSRLQICLPASSRPVVFDGYVVKHCGAVDPEGESLTAEVEDVLKVQLAGIPAGRWQSSDGAAVFLPEGQLAFNDDRQAHLASAEPLAVNGRMCRVFQPGPEGQLWSVLDILKFLVAAYARADLAVCGLEDASGPAAGIYPPRLSLEGLSLGEALSRVADLAGLAIRGSVTGPVGQVQRGLLFYRPGRTGCRRTVSLQRAGQALDSRRSNLLSGRIEFRSRPARRGLILLGGIKRHESTFALQPGWDRRKESYHYRDFVRGESADWLPVADVFRKWVLNETGRYCQEPYNLTRFDLASVSDDFLTASPRRFESCLSRDPAGASPGVVVEISTDGGETWRRYPGPVRIAGDECAVYLADDALGADYFQAALARTVALRVTATVASDRRLTAARAGDPGGGTVVHEAPSAGWAKVHSGSIFYRRADLPPAAERDDSDRLAALAEAVAASPAGGVEAELSLAWLDATRTVGDIVAAIAGRQLLLAALPDSWPYVCQVRHDCREWVTRLTVRG